MCSHLISMCACVHVCVCVCACVRVCTTACNSPRVYNACGDGCNSCHFLNPFCTPAECVPECQCPFGLMFNGDTCVQPSDCQCIMSSTHQILQVRVVRVQGFSVIRCTRTRSCGRVRRRTHGLAGACRCLHVHGLAGMHDVHIHVRGLSGTRPSAHVILPMRSGSACNSPDDSLAISYLLSYRRRFGRRNVKRKHAFRRPVDGGKTVGCYKTRRCSIANLAKRIRSQH